MLGVVAGPEHPAIDQPGRRRYLGKNRRRRNVAGCGRGLPRRSYCRGAGPEAQLAFGRLVPPGWLAAGGCSRGGNVLSGSIPRVVRRPLDWDLAPVEVLRLVGADVHPVALFGAWADGTEVISSEPVLVRRPPCSLGEVLDSPGPPGTAGGRAGYARHTGRHAEARSGVAQAGALSELNPYVPDAALSEVRSSPKHFRWSEHDHPCPRANRTNCLCWPAISRIRRRRVAMSGCRGPLVNWTRTGLREGVGAAVVRQRSALNRLVLGGFVSAHRTRTEER